jgi:hypothetical protein
MNEQALVTQVQDSAVEELEVHLAARNTEEMSQCQDKLKAWLNAKIKSERHNSEELEDAVSIAVQRKWGSATLKKHAALAKTRCVFYRKVLAAVEAGYTIIPNFPVDIFAIRVDRSSPQVKSYHKDSQYYAPNVTPPTVPTLALPDGEGRYVADAPKGSSTSQKVKVGDKEMIRSWFTVKEYGNVEFPISCARPVVMEATAQAMAVRVFDAIGICPQRHIRKDPLIIGQIRLHKQRKWGEPPLVSFLIAWHLDLRTL